MLMKGRRYFFVGNLVICSFITPDFLSTFFIVIPVQILMEIASHLPNIGTGRKRPLKLPAAAQSTQLLEVSAAGSLQ